MAAKRFDDGKSPVVSGCFNYFPNALLAVGLVSKFGSDKYEVSLSEKNWLGLEQARIVNSEGRHLLKEAIEGPYDLESKLLHKAHKAWNALADLEKELMAGTELSNPAVNVITFDVAQKFATKAINDLPDCPSLSDAARTVRETGHTDYTETLPPPAEKGVGASPFVADVSKKLHAELAGEGCTGPCCNEHAAIDTGETFQRPPTDEV